MNLRRYSELGTEWKIIKAGGHESLRAQRRGWEDLHRPSWSLRRRPQSQEDAMVTATGCEIHILREGQRNSRGEERIFQQWKVCTGGRGEKGEARALRMGFTGWGLPDQQLLPHQLAEAPGALFCCSPTDPAEEGAALWHSRGLS